MFKDGKEGLFFFPFSLLLVCVLFFSTYGEEDPKRIKDKSVLKKKYNLGSDDN